MPDVPAVCNTCGAFFPSGFAGEGGDATFVGCVAGPCPRCGGYGHIPDGLYRFTQNVVEILAAPARSRAEIRRLVAAIQSAKRRGATPQATRAAVEHEVPALAGLLRLMKPTNPGEFWAMIAALLAAATMLLGSSGKSTTINVNTVINNLYASPATQQPAHTRESGPQRQRKPARNASCPCGSERKFKKCCGAPRNALPVHVAKDGSR